VDRRIEKLEKKRALLTDYKKGLMQQLFSQSLRFTNPDGSPFPDWEEKRLGEVTTFIKGRGISKDELAERGRTPCILYGELYTHYRECISQARSHTNLDPRSLVMSQAGDVIIPSSGETAIDIATASCVMKTGIALGGDLTIIRTANKGIFLAYLLNSWCKQDIAKLAQGVSVMHLYARNLQKLTIPIPSLAEQQKIADCLSEIDRKIEQVETQVAQSQQFKKGLLQHMFV
jgi:type I restriction enzyme S subunit